MMFDQQTLLKTMNLEKRRSTTSRVFSTVGLLVGGALVGAAAALLLTPKSGPELRGTLMGSSKDLKKSAEPMSERIKPEPSWMNGRPSQPDQHA